MKALAANAAPPARPHIWEGIVVIDKPAGLSSNKVLQQLRKTVNFQKMGYLGTLDPLATGVLPVCIGWATKIIPFIPEQAKAYRAVMVLGQKTDTQDVTGEVVFTSSQALPEEKEIQAVCKAFVGVQEQIPPSFSALKYKGKPLYQWARRGIRISKPPRQITIESLKVLGVAGDRVTFEIHCSPGTYVRTVCNDMGERLGCGAFLEKLQRIQSGPFALAQAHTMEEIGRADSPERIAALKTPVEAILGDFPQISADWGWRDKIRQGMVLTCEQGFPPWPSVEPGRPICVKGPQGDLWAMYHQINNGPGALKPIRVII
jgi:tRNA pseudouridine55 synthase